MKKRLISVISLILVVTMLITVFSGTNAFANSGTTEYYVAPNGTGDGRTVDTPAGAITTVMQSIVNDGHGAGEDVTIYVKGGEGASAVPANGLVINYAYPWPSATTPANITITSMPGSESPAILSSSVDAPLVVLANTVFKNIIIHSGCSDEGIADRIFTNGYNVTFDEDVVFKKGNSLTDYAPKIHIGSGYSWGVQCEDSGTVIINNTSNNKNFTINFGGFTWNGEGESNAKYLKGNKTVIVNGGSVDALNLVGFMSNSQYDSNINVVLNGAQLNKAGVSERAGYEPTINGKIQIIANGTTLPDDVSGIVSYAKGKNIPYYVINSTSASNGSNDLLTLTDEVGTYLVKSGEVAVAVDLENPEQVFTSESEKLTVPVGKYLVTRKGTGGGEGIYYVRYGGTGDGLSPDKPLATVDDAVKAANMAGYSTDDTVYINVMQSADWDWGAGEIGAGGNYRADAHRMTTWAPRGALTEHKAKIVVQGFGEGAVYLATNGQLGFNLDMVLGGPTEFKNITIVRMRRWRGLLANGHDVTYGVGTVLGCVNVDDCDSNFKTWDGKVDILDGTTTVALGNVNKLPSGGGGKIEFDENIGEFTLVVSSITDVWAGNTSTGPSAAVEKYSKDINVVLNNPKLFSHIRWGNQFGGGTLIEKNINIIIKAANSVDYLAGTGTVIVNGDLQIISTVAMADISAIPSNIHVDGGKWFITNNGDEDLIELTENAGTYNIKEGVTVVATDVNDPTKVYTSVDGILTVPEGNYEVVKQKNAAVEATYYVQYGGTGDGLTPEKPLATVDDAVKAANSAGLTAGDTVYINVLQSNDWNWGAGTIGAGENYRSDLHHMTTWAARGVLTAHRAKIVVQGYGDGDVYLASNGALGLNLDLVLGGPTEFRNITIVRMRAWRGIYANGYDVSYDENTRIGVVNVDDCSSSFIAWDGQVSLVDGNAMYSLGDVKKLSGGGGGIIQFNNAPSLSTIYISSIADIWDSGVAEGPTDEVERYKNDVSIVFNNPKFAARIAWGNQYGGSTLFEKGLNINAKSVNTLDYMQGKGTVIVNGDLQIIAKAGSAITAIPDNVTVNGEKWFISNAGGSGLIDLTDTSGKYVIRDGIDVIATDLNDPKKTYTSVDGVLTVPAGSYIVTRLSSGGGEITYYVQYGGTGDGLSESTPLATVEDAVNAANDAGYGAGDTVYINVIQSADWNWGAGVIGAGGNYRSDEHHITTWSERGTMVAHKSTIVVQGVGDNYNSPIFLASNCALGRNLDMVLGGPTVFKNISIVLMRRWRGLLTNGYDVKYDEKTHFGSSGVDDCDSEFKIWKGSIDLGANTTAIGLGNTSRTADGGGGNVTFANDPADSTLYISGIYNHIQETEKYSNDVTVTYNNSKFVQRINWGQLEGGSSLFEKNLRFNILSVSKLTYQKGKGEVLINGGLEIIANCGELEELDITAIPNNVKVKGGKWFITNNGNAELEFTDISGTYTVKDGKQITAVDTVTKKKYTSNGGILTLPSGAYVIEEIDDGVWWSADDIDEGEDFSKVTVKGTFKDSDGNPIKNTKLQLVSDAKTYTATTDKNGNFSFDNIRAGFYELFAVDGSGKQYVTDYFSNFDDGDTVTINLVLKNNGIFTSNVEMPNNNYEEVILEDEIIEENASELINGIIKGYVYTPDLKPVANLQVHLGDYGSVFTDKNGYFEFVDVPVGKYDVFTFMEDGSRQIMRTLEVKENTELSMKLKYEASKSVQETNKLNIIWIVLPVCVLMVTLVLALSLLIIKKKKQVNEGIV